MPDEPLARPVDVPALLGHCGRGRDQRQGEDRSPEVESAVWGRDPEDGRDLYLYLLQGIAGGMNLASALVVTLIVAELDLGTLTAFVDGHRHRLAVYCKRKGAPLRGARHPRAVGEAHEGGPWDSWVLLAPFRLFSLWQARLSVRSVLVCLE